MLLYNDILYITYVLGKVEVILYKLVKDVNVLRIF